MQRLSSNGSNVFRRVQKFRSDYMELRLQFDGAKRQATDSVCGELPNVSGRGRVLTRRPST